MRVIADAQNNPKIWKAEVSCTGKGMDNDYKRHSPCGSLLEINASDIKHGTRIGYGGFWSGYERYKTDYFYFICPVCGNATELTGKDLKDYLSNT